MDSFSLLIFLINWPLERGSPLSFICIFFKGRSLWDLIFERKLFISGGGFQGKDFCAYSLYIYKYIIIRSSIHVPNVSITIHAIFLF